MRTRVTGSVAAYTALVILCSASLLTLYACLSQRTRPETHYISTERQDHLLCVPAAKYLSPARLLAGDDAIEYSGIPKLLHQSWSERELPVLFRKWSDTLRLRHPHWQWVSHPYDLR
jgi:mannosyltransferase OCH1-like enzyme